MSLSDEQWEFLQDVSELIRWAKANNFKLTGGELYRTQDQQKLYYYGKRIVVHKDGVLSCIDDKKRSKTLRSRHTERLAIDLNVFVNGRLAWEPEDLKSIGEFWKSLNPQNVWGGDWGWDAGHFERKPS